MNKQTIVEHYFRAREISDINAFLELFTNDVEIYNVHFPVYRGTEGIRNYCDDFKQRISTCRFETITILEDGETLMAEWKATLQYRVGAVVAGITVAKPFELNLRGINRFDFIGEKIKCVRIYHETTTVMNLARENSV